MHYLVHFQKLFDEVLVNFMVPGHTKFSVDGAFGVTKNTLIIEIQKPMKIFYKKFQNLKRMLKYLPPVNFIRLNFNNKRSIFMIEKHFFLNFIRKLTLKSTFSKDMNLDYAKKFQI